MENMKTRTEMFEKFSLKTSATFFSKQIFRILMYAEICNYME